MKFMAFSQGTRKGLAVASGSVSFRGRLEGDALYPGNLSEIFLRGPGALVEAGKALTGGAVVDPAAVKFEIPVPAPRKILCIGLNYADHSAESNMKTPDFPTVFARFATSLVPHGASLVCPRVSSSFDYEGEMVAVIGKGGRHIEEANALDHVAAYSVFNDGSVRDYQLRTPQWTVGKNFDGTGGFGPFLVTADELPPGGAGLKISTTLNGQTVQKASTDDLFFPVAKLVSLLSIAMTLEPGDLIVTGTPAGVGAARKPPLFMKPGDVCEVEVEGIGKLRNEVVAEQ